MNKAYRLIWSAAKDAWVIAAEIVKGKGGPPPLTRALLATASVLALSTGVQALPTGSQIVNGNVSMTTQGSTLTVTNTPNSIINWQGFSIAAGETTRFVQQSTTSTVLNRVVGVDPSSIMGTLQSNGRIFLVNPNGIIFGQGSRVDAAGLVASSLNMSDTDFMGGRYLFNAGPSAGAVKNQGEITTTNGGHVWLIAPNVENSGIITSPGGTVTLAAGQSVHVVDPNKPEVAVVVSAPTDQAINLGSMVAQGGRIAMYGAIVGQKGTVNANSATRGENGKIYFKSTKGTTIGAGSVTTANGPDGGSIIAQTESGDTMVSGNISASGTDGRGGTIQLLGQRVGLIDNANIDASGTTGGGTILIGGDYQGKNPDIQNAQATYVGKDTIITADSLFKGDGGKVIVWADNTTRAFGSISARGGFGGGNGGFVETSGKNFLDVNGIKVNTLAAEGNAGNWLLDPTNIFIALDLGTANTAGMIGVDTSASTYSLPNFSTTLAVQDSLVDTGTLVSNLVTGSVIVNTANANGSGIGNINVVSPFTWGTANSLTLTANNNIAIKANINGTAGTLVLSAPGTVSQTTGSINVSGLALLGVGTAGTFNLNNGGNVVNTLASVNGNTINFTGNGSAALLSVGTVAGTVGIAAAGPVNIVSPGGAISLTNGISSPTSNISLTSAGNFNSAAAIQGANISISTTSGGNIALGSAGVLAVGGAINLVASGASNTISYTGSFDASSLTANAGGLISLTGANNVQTVNLINSSNANITYSGGNISLINGQSAGGIFSVTSSFGNIGLGSITNLGGTVSINAPGSTDSITNAIGGMNIKAAQATLTAGSNIGTSLVPVQTSVTTLSATSTMGVPPSVFVVNTPPVTATTPVTAATLMTESTVVQGINIAIVPTDESDPASAPQAESDEEKAKKEAKAKKDAEDKQNKKGEEGQQYCN